MELVKSSNFNSRAPRWQWDMGEILKDFRTTLSSNYFVVSFKERAELKRSEGMSP